MSESNSIKNRVELLFLYDVRDANPNGDPDNQNMPRMDEETGENIVTDLRLKRTIRDYWLANNIKVLVRPEMDNNGKRKTMEALVRDELGNSLNRELINVELPKRFIDVRAFGAAVTAKNANVSITGAVQFGLGRSLNRPNINTIAISPTLASGEDRGAGTLGVYHIVDYSLIRFHGIISEINARATGFSDNDLESLLEAMWNGTLMLNTRSKFNHTPRLMLAVIMKEGEMQIGDLDLYIKLFGNNEPKSIEEVKVDVSELTERLETYKDKIELIRLKIDKNLTLTDKNGDSIDLEKKLKALKIIVEGL